MIPAGQFTSPLFTPTPTRNPIRELGNPKLDLGGFETQPNPLEELIGEIAPMPSPFNQQERTAMQGMFRQQFAPIPGNTGTSFQVGQPPIIRDPDTFDLERFQP